MSRLSLIVAVAFVTTLAALSTTCGYYDDPESQVYYENGTFSDDFVWDFQRTATLELTVAEAQRPESGEARVEVRHTVYDGPVLFRCTLSDENGWGRTITARLPQHETALTVTVETRDGLVRHVVPIAEDGRAHTVFE